MATTYNRIEDGKKVHGAVLDYPGHDVRVEQEEDSVLCTIIIDGVRFISKDDPHNVLRIIHENIGEDYEA